LELEDIYISTQTACSLNNSVSASVLSLTNAQERAKSSVRISLSPITTKKELEEFIVKFDKVYNELGEKHENN
jgi:cysteine sulfinate desulfinase/cysteine desulfurase-like protein